MWSVNFCVTQAREGLLYGMGYYICTLILVFDLHLSFDMIFFFIYFPYFLRAYIPIGSSLTKIILTPSHKQTRLEDRLRLLF